MNERYPFGRKNLVALAALCMLAGCIQEIPGVYRIDIQQGNVVDQHMLDQLERGMEKRKVRFLLGTPVLVDTFNQDRWDYFYSMAAGGVKRQQRRIALFFEDDRLIRIEGDVKPASAARDASVRRETLVVVPQERPSSGFLDALTPDFLKNEPRKRALASASPSAEVESAPEALGEDPQGGDLDAEPDADESTIAAAAEPPPALDSEAQAGFFKRLFKGFGKTGVTDSTDATLRGGAAPDAGDASSRELSPTVARAADESAEQAAPAAEEEQGFFKKLVKRFRRLRKSRESATGDESADPPEPIEAPAEP